MNPRQRAFVHAYLANGGDATKAAIAAGYSSKNAAQSAHQVLLSTEVQAALTKALDKAGFTTAKAMSELAAIAEHQVEKISASDKLKAIELFLKANGALREKEQASRITVNIGFLSHQQGTGPTTIEVTASDGQTAEVMAHHAPVALPGGLSPASNCARALSPASSVAVSEANTEAKGPPIEGVSPRDVA